MNIKKHLSIMKISFLNALAYKYDFLFRGIFFVIILFIFKQIWLNAPLRNTQFTVPLLIWYLVLTESIMLSFPDVRSRVDTDIKTGTIAIMLSKPFHYPLYLYMLFIGEMLPRFLVNITLGVCAAYYFVGGIAVSSAAFLTILCFILSFSIHFFIALTIALLSFWVEETQPFFWIYHKILFTIGGLLIPIEFFPDFLRKISENLPFTVILYRPAKLFINFDLQTFYTLITEQLVWFVILIIVCETIFSCGTRRLNINGG